MESYKIREIRENEISRLGDFLYEAIFIPEGVQRPPRDIINRRELRVYIENFGKHNSDYCLVTEIESELVGACWARIMNDYGHIDNETPSLAISLYREHRSKGIGTEMMKGILALLKNNGYKQTSLAVQKANYAVKMYEKLGFNIIAENDEEYIMVCKL